MLLYPIIFLLLHPAFSQNIGWKSYFIENSDEFHDIPLIWELNASTVPAWISGTYVRNGPAQISFGSPRRILSSWLEGFAKLHSFKMDGSRMVYSGRMLQSPNYLASVEKGELVPMITLNKFARDEEEWDVWEKMQIVGKMALMTEFGNNNPALWRIGRKEGGIYLAVTDGKVPTRFNISDLSTLGQEYPAYYPIQLSGCAHWMREVGTDNSINFQYKKGWRGAPWVEVLRYRPEDTYQTPEVVASFTPRRFSYMHSFSITENYAIFFFYPITIDGEKASDANFHVFELFNGGNQTDSTDIYVVNLKSGQVKGPFQTEYTYSAHHANAYEATDSQLVIDLTPTPFQNLRDYLLLDNMLNPPKAFNVSTTGDLELTRYFIDLATNTVSHANFPNIIDSKFVNTFDFPTINEAYRGRSYCYLYGLSAFAYTRMALVKKDVCDPSQDKVWSRPNHYPSEMHFLANPRAEAEDDGVLITVVFDGEKEQSYVMIIDGATFTPVNIAYLAHNIPWSAHGMYFPEAHFPLH